VIDLTSYALHCIRLVVSCRLGLKFDVHVLSFHLDCSDTVSLLIGLMSTHCTPEFVEHEPRRPLLCFDGCDVARVEANVLLVSVFVSVLYKMSVHMCCSRPSAVHTDFSCLRDSAKAFRALLEFQGGGQRGPTSAAAPYILRKREVKGPWALWFSFYLTSVHNLLNYSQWPMCS